MLRPRHRRLGSAWSVWGRKMAAVAWKWLSKADPNRAPRTYEVGYIGPDDVKITNVVATLHVGGKEQQVVEEGRAVRASPSSTATT